MRVILVGPQLSGGHHPVYVRLITEEAIRRGWRIKLLTSRASATRELLDRVVPSDPKVSVHGLMEVDFPADGGFVARFEYQYQMFKALREGVRQLAGREPIDFVYVTNLDCFSRVAPFLGAPFDLPFSGLLANVGFHLRRSGVVVPRSRREPIEAWMFRRLLCLPMLKALLTTDDTLPAHEQALVIQGSEKIQCIPELVTVGDLLDRSSARAKIGIKSDSFVVLCYGALSARKGVSQLLDALVLESCPKEVVVLLAGRQEDDVRLLMQGETACKLRAQGRLIEWNRYVTPEEEVRAYSACDLVWLGYVGYYGISGVTIQSAVSGRPSVACQEGIVGHWVRTHNIGLTTDVRNPHNVIEAIEKIRTNTALRRAMENNGTTLRSRHSTTGFACAICDRIQQCSGVGR